MVQAPTLDNIIADAKETFSDPIIVKKTVYKDDGSADDKDINDGSDGEEDTLHLMTSSNGQSPIKKQITERKVFRNSKLIGILFCNPNSELGKAEIFSDLTYCQYRSGTMCDFYLAGYGVYWPPDQYVDQKPVVSIDGSDWLFSEVAFNNIRKDLESSSDWIYSGKTELILLSVEKKNGEISLNFDLAITCNLEQMKIDNAFTSVRSFFGKIFQFAENNLGEDPIWHLSDREGLSKSKDLLLDAVLSLIPEHLRDTYKSAKHFAVSNISRKA